jgi:hypothetical protein
MQRKFLSLILVRSAVKLERVVEDDALSIQAANPDCATDNKEGYCLFVVPEDREGWTHHAGKHVLSR